MFLETMHYKCIKENQGKLKTTPYVKVTNIEELSLAYSIEAVESCKSYEESRK